MIVYFLSEFFQLRCAVAEKHFDIRVIFIVYPHIRNYHPSLSSMRMINLFPGLRGPCDTQKSNPRREIVPFRIWSSGVGSSLCFVSALTEIFASSCVVSLIIFHFFSTHYRSYAYVAITVLVSLYRFFHFFLFVIPCPLVSILSNTNDMNADPTVACLGVGLPSQGAHP